MKWHNARAEWSKRPDRAQQNQRRLAVYWNDPEPAKTRARNYRLLDPEKVRAADRIEYQRNKEKHTARVVRYRKLHPELGHKVYLLAKQRYPWKPALSNAANRAGKKKLAFDLTKEWCEKRWTGNCELTGSPFVFGSQRYFPFSPSIDRIRSDLGYTQDNCRFVLFAINSFKGTGTDEQMLEIAKALISHQKLAPSKL